MATVKLFAHAIVLVVWAVLWKLLEIDPTSGVIAFMLATIAAGSVVAERERSRRRRAQSEG